MTSNQKTRSQRLTLSLGVAALVALPGTALAQDADSETDADGAIDIEVPALVLETSDVDGGYEDDSELDLANVVQSAARSVTTVQEAPAIVTVLTSEEIEERQVRNMLDLLDTVPGYLGVSLLHHQFPHAAARGQVQSSQLLHDGVSMFEPFVNIATQNAIVPIELIKRVEVITGPGGVLWGANSLVGIINIITKDAEDLVAEDGSWGTEVGVMGGEGNGNRKYFHGYVMAGKTELFSDDSKLLVHAQFKTYQAAGIELAQQQFSAPLPQPNSPVLYGPLTKGDPDQSFMFSAFAKLTLNSKTQLRVMVPFMDRKLAAGFPGVIIQKDSPQDNLPQCNELDSDGDGIPGEPEDIVINGDGCTDKLRASRKNDFDYFDRYAVLEYRTRLAGGKAGLAAKVYANQFVRNMSQIQVLTPIEGLLEGGLAFGANLSTFRVGGSIDGDAELGGKARVLYGAEAFHEWAPSDAERNRQGAEGLEATFVAPYQLERLPLPCPRERDPDNPGSSRPVAGCPLLFSFPSSRTALSAYVSPQWRPNKKLILDTGARIAVAPEALGKNFYEPTLTFAGTVVYNFIPNWHVKLNYSQGFRPPVFNNMNSNGEAVQLDGGELETETTDAFQGELNARIFKGDRRIRELNFRMDVSYTRVQNLIQIQSGRYQNAADRGIASVEFLGKLYIQGGHRLELGYTYININTADKGEFQAIPEHWFNLLGVYNISDDKLRAFTNLRVLGAMEDANRLVEHRDLHYCTQAENLDGICALGDVLRDQTVVGYISTLPTELVMDRIPASAELSLGMTFTPTSKLEITAEAFNAFNGRFYQPDLFYDYEPRLEFLPNPREDLRVFVGANYKY